MSIQQLKKMTIFAPVKEKLQILEEIQTIGCLHIIPLTIHEDILEKNHPVAQIKEALKYLQSCQKKLRQIKEISAFDAAAVERQILQNKQQMEQLQDERDIIKKKLTEIEPWGNFQLPKPNELRNLNFWFYVIPHKEVKNIKTKNVCLNFINKDLRFTYVVVVSEKEPDFMPGNQVKLSDESYKELEKRLDQVEFKIEDLQEERIHLTRWLDLFESHVFKLEDQAQLNETIRQTYDEDPVFALQAWVPVSEVDRVREYTKKKQLAVEIRSPTDDEIPPTLLINKPLLKCGEDIISFYMTPNYWLWDPSSLVFFSFAIFFAMIFSDAGYAILLGAILALFWKRMGTTISGQRFRTILLVLTIFSFLWGLLVGSYFGITPLPQSYLGYLKVVDMNDYPKMMGLAILVGVIHLFLANLVQAWCLRNSVKAFANIGWATVLVGAVLTFIGFKYVESSSQLKTWGIGLIVLGLLTIVLFTSEEKPAWKRILKGFIGLTKVSGMFGDVLSYLRLFALGLASASLAAVFNDLAKQVYSTLPSFKIVFALFILLIGHGMNFALSLMSGFIHGLRLNFIEFFNWGLPEEGTPFKAFSKKEMSKWNQ